MRTKTLQILQLKKLAEICVVGLLCLLIASCEKSEKGTPLKPERVVLMYMGGDNNLSDETYEKMESICQTWLPNPQDRLLIYTDPADDTPKLYELSEKNGKTTQRLIYNYNEENSADWQVLSRVITDVKALYNPITYGLIIFSHASGWLPKQTLARPQSVIVDNNDEMELRELATAIPDGTFDFIIFEACFMAGVEVAYELKDKTDYVVASSAEIVSPGFTPVYGTAISYLFEPKPNLAGFVDRAFSYFSSQTGYQNSATFSIIKTAELEKLASWILGNAIWTKKIDINEIQHFDRYSYRLFFDFEDYYSRLLLQNEQKQILANLVSSCVVYKKSTPTFMISQNGFEVKKYSGMTSYISQDKFPFLNSEYKKLSWSKATGFNK